MKTSIPLFNRPEFALLQTQIFEMLRYGMIGSSSVLSYLLISNLLYFLGNPAWFAVTLAYIVNISVSYFGHIHFTYKVPAQHSRMSWRFLLLAATNLLIAQVTTYLMHNHFHVSFLMTTIFLSLGLPFISWPVGKFWVFAPMKQTT